MINFYKKIKISLQRGTMIGIDTNILVRYLTNDDEEQCKIVSSLLNQHSGNKGNIYVNNIVLCELIWVLESGYKYSREVIVNAVKALLQTMEFKFDHHELLVLAIMEYAKSEATDFADILITLSNKKNGCKVSYSFDKALSKLSNVEILESV